MVSSAMAPSAAIWKTCNARAASRVLTRNRSARSLRRPIRGRSRRRTRCSAAEPTAARSVLPAVPDAAETTLLENEPELLRRAQAGDEEAFGELMRAYYERVFRTVVGVVRD